MAHVARRQHGRPGAEPVGRCGAFDAGPIGYDLENALGPSSAADPEYSDNSALGRVFL